MKNQMEKPSEKTQDQKLENDSEGKTEADTKRVKKANASHSLLTL
jgi:hypothetical protein